ncbi:AMP-binding protein [Nocardia sp. NPDC056952]|uniref:AMP-binding protein n=1 Tax=Nocardia sp. NPDC056952 TaxID=3345979 RepID=UPI0036309A3D
MTGPLPAGTTPPYPIHPAQSALIHQHGRVDRTSVNCAYAYLLLGDMAPEQLAAAYERALQRFDALYLTMSDDQWFLSEQPRFRIRLHRNADTESFDLSTLPSRAQTHAATRFRLDEGPLATIDIDILSDGRLLIVEAFDHVIADGHSLHLLHDSLFAAASPTELPSVASYAHLLQYTPSPSTHKFWADHYTAFEASHTPVVDPADIQAQRTIRFEAETVSKIAAAARSSRATLSAAVLAAHAHAVSRFQGTGDVAVFVPVDTRRGEDLSVFGQTTHLLPIRVQHDWLTTIRDHVRLLTRTTLEVRDHCLINISDLDAVGAPISARADDASVFVFQHRPALPPELPGHETRPVPLPPSNGAGGITTVVHHHLDGTMAISVRVPRGSRHQHHVDAITDTIARFLDLFVHDGDAQLGGDLLLPKMIQRQLAELSSGGDDYPLNDIAADIVSNLDTLGGRPVVFDGTEVYSARQLCEEIYRIRAELIEEGIGSGDAVLCFQSAPFQQIARFVAIQAVGATYVPIADEPPDGIHKQLATAFRIWESRGDQPLLHVGQEPTSAANGPISHAAYVIFTSGTTGRPKGVAVSPRALANLVQGEADRFDLNERSRVLLISPTTADPWICHVAGALHVGAGIVSADPTDPELAETLERRHVTHAFFPAQLLSTLPPRPYPDLKVLASAGDRCSLQDLRRQHRPGRRLFNIYGPTEATVTAAVAEINLSADSAPIGRPIRGLEARIVFDRTVAAPPQVAGELVLSGAGIALGYLDEKLTDERFGRDPATDERTYATGDHAWFGADGNLHFLGRQDRQVKIRGFRVELGHIEQLARETGLCEEARAVLSDDAPPRLLLYVEGCQDASWLRARLTDQYPAHLVPHQIIIVDPLPRQASGNIDDIALRRTNAGASHEFSVTLSQEPLALAWTRVLGAPHERAHFFDDGGDSLDLLRFVHEARSLGASISPSDVRRTPHLAALIADPEPMQPSRPARTVSQPNRAQLGPVHRWFIALQLPEPNRWNQQHTMLFDRLPSVSALRSAIQAVVTACPILTATVSGDAFIFGQNSGDQWRMHICEDRSDAAITECLETLHSGMNTREGPLFGAAVIRGPEASGALILAGHHFAVDDWSWQLLASRIRHALDTGETLPVDDGYRRFATALSRRLAETPTAPSVAAPWARLLSSGYTSDLHRRPKQLLRHTEYIETANTRKKHSTAATVLVALAHGLADLEPGQHSVIDLERSGRTALPELDLSDAVGWYGSHHPVLIAHRRSSSSQYRELSDLIGSVPLTGLSYGVTRWVEHALAGTAIGRFALNISDTSAFAAPLTDFTRQLRRCAVPLTGTNKTPYEATFTIRRVPKGFHLIVAHDPDRIEPDAVQTLCRAMAIELTLQSN